MAIELPRIVDDDARVHLSRAGDMVADRIRTRVLSGELEDGDRLPSFEALLQEFGVSPASLREALRILESEGLIHVRRGTNGGAVIRRPDATNAAYNVSLILSSQ